MIVVASVSCIYGLGSPEDFAELRIELRRGAALGRNRLLERLVDNLYERNDYELKRGRFRVRGDVVDVMPAYLGAGTAGGVLGRRHRGAQRVRSADRRRSSVRSSSSTSIRPTST